MRPVVILYFSATLVVAHAVPSQAQQEMKLTLAEAVRLAQAHSPTMQQAEARVAGAQARLQGAKALPNPTVALAAPFGQGTGGLDEDVVATQTIELGGKRQQRVRVARAERGAAAAEQSGTTADVVLNTENAYFEALRADSERSLAAGALATAEAFAKAAETQFQAGDVSRSNVVRSRVELARAQQALAAADTERANRYAALLSLTGLPEATPLVLTDTLEFAPVSYKLADLQALALRSRPDVLSARLLAEARGAALLGARRASRPDLFVEYRHATLDPFTGGNSLRVGVVFPLLDLGSTRADVRAAAAAVAEQMAAVAEAERTARLEVETALHNVNQASQAVESFRSGRLDRAKELLDMAQTGYRMGASSYIELLDAQQVYLSEQTEYARALASFNEAKAALQRAVGGKLP